MSDAEKLVIAITALKEITERQGAYSTDQLTHAENVIDAMALVAETALDKIDPVKE